MSPSPLQGTPSPSPPSSVLPVCPTCGAERAGAHVLHEPPTGRTAPDGSQEGRRASESTSLRGDFTLQRERRIVTVLFADISGFTAMTGRMDVEDLTGLLDCVFATMSRVIQEYGGMVDKYLGDAVMGVCGAPRAHEDDAERAVRAALKMKREVAGLASDTGLPIRLGIGINTGPVIAGGFGTGDRADYTVIGDTVNLAARLESLCEPGQILMTQATRDRCLNACEAVPLGPKPIRGKPRPLEIFEAREASREPRRSAAPATEIPPLVGRSPQVRRIQQLLAQLAPVAQPPAAEGSDAAGAATVPMARGGRLLFSGEVGAGKTRLAIEVGRLATELGLRVVSASCETWNEGRLRGLMERCLWELLELGSLEGDAAELKLREAIDELGLDSPDLKHDVLGRYLGLWTEEGRKSKVSTARLRDELKEALTAIFRAAAVRQPLVVLADNLQWAEPATFELLALVGQLTEVAPLVLICFSRAGNEDALAATLPAIEQMVLSRLDVRRSGQLAAALLGVPEVPPQFAALMAERTGGNPFFIEETVKDLLARGQVQIGEPVPALEELQIPSSVQEVILARIDRLDSETKAVLQVAAVIGRTFRSEVLAAVTQEDPARLVAHLDLLEECQFIFPLSPGDHSQYMFKHNVTRDVAYETLLRRNRSYLHGQIAEVLEGILGQNVEEEVATLACHYLETDRNDKKAEYLIRAGRAEQHRGNSADAERFLLLADEVIPPRDVLRNELDAVLARLYRAAGRHQEAVQRLTAIVERSPVLEERYRALVERGHNLYFLGEFSRAEDDLRRVISVDAGDEIVANAYRVLALMRRDQGRSEPALKYCSEAIRLLENSEDMSARADAFTDYADSLTALGREEDALAAYQRARVLYDRLGAKERLAGVYNNIGVRHRRLGDLERAREFYDMCLEIALDLGSWRHVSVAHHNLANLHTLSGDFDEAMAAYNEALKLREQHGARRQVAETLLALTDLHRHIGQLQEAQECCERGIQLFIEQGMSAVLPQAYTELSSLLIERGRLDEAETALQKAAEVADDLALEDFRPILERHRAELTGARGNHAEADAMLQQLAAAKIGADQVPARTAPGLALLHARVVMHLDLARARAYLEIADQHARSLGAGGGARAESRHVAAVRAELEKLAGGTS